MTFIQNIPGAKARMAVLFLLMMVICLNIIGVMYASHWLRPAADDYCNAWVTGRFGVLGAVIDSWQTFSGYLTSVWNAMFWVGWPLAHLPLSIASAIPFLAASYGLGIALLGLKFGREIPGRKRYFWIPIMTAFLWWGFLWAPEAFNGLLLPLNLYSMRDPYLLAHGLTHWQTLNAIYMMQLLSILVIGGFLLSLSDSLMPYRRLFLMVFGLYCGMTGPTLAVSLIALLFIYFVYEELFLGSVRVMTRLEYALISVFITAGLLASHFLSPGYQRRLSMLGSRPEVSIVNLLDASFQYAIKFTFSVYFSLGAFIVLIFVAGFVYLYRSYRVDKHNFSVFGAGFVFMVFALVQIFVNRASEFFAYQGYWHFIGALVCIFFSIIYFGVGIGNWMIEKWSDVKYFPVISVLMLLVILMCTSTNFYMGRSIYQRQSLWSGGSGAIEGIADIEVDWIKGCWENLNRMRPSSIAR